MTDLPSFQEIQSWIANELQNNEWFKTVGFFGILSAVWIYFKGFPKYIWDRIKRRITYTVSIYETDIFFEYFEIWLKKNHKKSNVVATAIILLFIVALIIIILIL